MILLNVHISLEDRISGKDFFVPATFRIPLSTPIVVYEGGGETYLEVGAERYIVSESAEEVNRAIDKQFEFAFNSRKN